LQITFAAPQALPPLPVAVETAAYYITLEALSNVQSHAQARTCQIVLRLLAAPPAVRSALELEISDDGVGLPAEGSQGLGLLSMQARAAEVGGSCTIQPAPTGGVRVLARLPILVVQP
jgi:signal transduction histidine kinase